MQAEQCDHKKTKDFKPSISAGPESDKKSASQHQGNFCYMGDDCEQANQGQQVVGKDNDAKGFNDQSDNLPPLSTSALSSTPGTPTTSTTNIGNLTVIADNSICDQTNTGSTSATSGAATSSAGSISNSGTITVTFRDNNITSKVLP